MCFPERNAMFQLLNFPPIKVHLCQEPAEPRNFVQVYYFYYTLKLGRGLGYSAYGPLFKEEFGTIFETINRSLKQAKPVLNSALWEIRVKVASHPALASNTERPVSPSDSEDSKVKSDSTWAPFHPRNFFCGKILRGHMSGAICPRPSFP